MKNRLRLKIKMSEIIFLLVWSLGPTIFAIMSIVIIQKKGLYFYAVNNSLLFSVSLFFIVLEIIGIISFIKNYLIGIKPKAVYLLEINQNESSLLFKMKNGKLLRLKNKRVIKNIQQYQATQFYDVYIHNKDIIKVLGLTKKSFPLIPYHPNKIIKYFQKFYGPYGKEYESYVLIILYVIIVPIILSLFTGNLWIVLMTLITFGIPLFYILNDFYYKIKWHYFEDEFEEDI